MKNTTLSKQLAEHQLVMSQFIHEIRNPLTLINCKLQMITTTHPEATDWIEIEDIQEYLTYIKNLISEFSDYNNAGKIQLQSANISAFLNNIANSYRPMFDYLGIQFITHFPETFSEMHFDALRLRQAITNLLRNAEEAINHDHGKIIFSASYINQISNPSLHISVSDNGCGIKPEHFTTIGTPFVTYKENGTGLGLSITRQIIEAHGGTFYIESIPLQGTTAHISLPLARMIK